MNLSQLSRAGAMTPLPRDLDPRTTPVIRAVGDPFSSLGVKHRAVEKLDGPRGPFSPLVGEVEGVHPSGPSARRHPRP